MVGSVLDRPNPSHARRVWRRESMRSLTSLGRKAAWVVEVTGDLGLAGDGAWPFLVDVDDADTVDSVPLVRRGVA